jgi:hypothetical protein
MSTFIVSRKDGAGAAETVDSSELLATCDRMSAQGVHPLNVKPLGETVEAKVAATIDAIRTVAVDDVVIVPPAPVNSTWETQVVDDAARQRIEGMHATLTASGVVVNASHQLYATGTRMADVGYETQAARKVEHDAKVSASEAIDALSALIVDEKRRDQVVTARELGAAINVNGRISAFGLTLTEQAIRGLALRLESPMLGYVLGLRERIAAEYGRNEDERNTMGMQSDKRKIADILAHECARAGDVELQLRTRENVGDVYAVVSPGYTEADFPRVAPELLAGLPGDARATFAYDPDRTQWELRASVWTPTATAEQAVGEPFEGFVSFKSRDNGTSRYRGEGGISLLRCLNASTYSANGSRVSRVHRRGILNDVGTMITQSTQAIDALCEAWGTARKSIVVTPTGVPIGEAIPGFWRYCLSTSTRAGGLAGILAGRKETHVEGLTEAFHAERRDPVILNRADFAQGWTRYIQAQPADIRRDAESAIGTWVVSRDAGGFELRA